MKKCSQNENMYGVRVISRRELFEKAERFADARVAVRVWLHRVTAASWRNLEELRRDFPATDMVGPLAIFNIKGNRYRLIVRMVFEAQRVYIKEFLTHAEYDQGGWKTKWLP